MDTPQFETVLDTVIDVPSPSALKQDTYKCWRESEQPQPPQVTATTKGVETGAGAAAAASPILDDESFVLDRYHEDVTVAIQMEEDEANGRGDGGKKGRRKYRQDSRYR